MPRLRIFIFARVLFVAWAALVATGVRAAPTCDPDIQTVLRVMIAPHLEAEAWGPMERALELAQAQYAILARAKNYQARSRHHLRLLDAAESYLDAAGVATRRIPARGSIRSTLRLLPDASTALGRRAAEIEGKFGYKVIYNPGELFGDGFGYLDNGYVQGNTLGVAPAAFRHWVNALEDPTAMHEIFHAAIETYERNGRRMLLRAEMTADVGRSISPLTSSSKNFVYRDYQSFEEFLTYPYELEFVVRRMQRTRGLAADDARLAASITWLTDLMLIQSDYYLQILTRRMENPRFLARNIEFSERAAGGGKTHRVLEAEITSDRVLFTLPIDVFKAKTGPSLIERADRVKRTRELLKQLRAGVGRMSKANSRVLRRYMAWQEGRGTLGELLTEVRRLRRVAAEID